MLAALATVSLLVPAGVAVLQENNDNQEAIVSGSGDFSFWDWDLFSEFHADDRSLQKVGSLIRKHGKQPTAEHKCNASVPGFAENLRKLKARFKPEWREQLQDAVQLCEAMPILMIANNKETCLLDNFLAHADSVPRGLDVLVAGLDQTTVDACESATTSLQNVKLQCFDFSTWISDFAQGHTNWTPDEMRSENFGSCMYKATVWTKVVLLEVAAAKSSGVLFMDADIVLHDDLPAWVEANREDDALLMFGDEGNDKPNSGTVWAGPNSTGVLKKWYDAIQEDEVLLPAASTQAGINFLLKTNPGLEDHIQILPRSAVGQCSKKGKFASHYNCVKSKVRKMKTHGHWNPRSEECA